MHTNTSKQILTPLAEAVFSLILIIAESEISNSPIQDLTKLASAVDAQITNLVKIGEKIMGQSTSDDKLKEEMPKSCKEGIKKARKNF